MRRRVKGERAVVVAVVFNVLLFSLAAPGGINDFIRQELPKTYRQ